MDIISVETQFMASCKLNESHTRLRDFTFYFLSFTLKSWMRPFVRRNKLRLYTGAG